VTLAADNWSNSAAPIRFESSALSANTVATFNLQTIAVGLVGIYEVRDTDEYDVVNLFSIWLCSVAIPLIADEFFLDVDTVIAHVMGHELGHALGLRDGYQRDVHPTVLGGSMRGSIMNNGNEAFEVTAPTAFDIASVRLVYDDLP